MKYDETRTRLFAEHKARPAFILRQAWSNYLDWMHTQVSAMAMRGRSADDIAGVLRTLVDQRVAHGRVAVGARDLRMHVEVPEPVEVPRWCDGEVTRLAAVYGDFPDTMMRMAVPGHGREPFDARKHLTMFHLEADSRASFARMRERLNAWAVGAGERGEVQR